MKALILVDLQNDFMAGGALPVKEADAILPIVKTLLDCPFDLRIASKDWHPRDHGSFALNHGKKVGDQIILNGLTQILWPNHCLQKSRGAEFCPGWNSELIDKIVYKGTDKNIDSYSVFYDNGHLKSTGLTEFLRDKQATDIFIAGLATDYCVKFSVLDALKEGFSTHVITDGCRGVNLQPEDSLAAFQEMQNAGAFLTSLKSVKRMLALKHA